AAEAGEELDAQLFEIGEGAGLIRGDPLPAELVRLAADLDVEDAPADAIARPEDDDVAAGVGERPCRRQAGDARPDDDDIRFDPVHRATNPPSTGITAPVTKRASSDRSHATGPAISSGVPQRPSGVRVVASSRLSGSMSAVM